MRTAPRTPVHGCTEPSASAATATAFALPKQEKFTTSCRPHPRSSMKRNRGAAAGGGGDAARPCPPGCSLPPPARTLHPKSRTLTTIPSSPPGLPHGQGDAASSGGWRGGLLTLHRPHEHPRSTPGPPAPGISPARTQPRAACQRDPAAPSAPRAPPGTPSTPGCPPASRSTPGHPAEPPLPPTQRRSHRCRGRGWWGGARGGRPALGAPRHRRWFRFWGLPAFKEGPDFAEIASRPPRPAPPAGTGGEPAPAPERGEPAAPGGSGARGAGGTRGGMRRHRGRMYRHRGCMHKHRGGMHRHRG